MRASSRNEYLERLQREAEGADLPSEPSRPAKTFSEADCLDSNSRHEYLSRLKADVGELEAEKKAPPVSRGSRPALVRADSVGSTGSRHEYIQRLQADVDELENATSSPESKTTFVEPLNDVAPKLARVDILEMDSSRHEYLQRLKADVDELETVDASKGRVASRSKPNATTSRKDDDLSSSRHEYLQRLKADVDGLEGTETKEASPSKAELPTPVKDFKDFSMDSSRHEYLQRLKADVEENADEKGPENLVQKAAGDKRTPVSIPDSRSMDESGALYPPEYDGHFSKLLISRKEVRDRTAQLAQVIHEDYKRQRPVLVCVLKAACPFYMQLLESLMELKHGFETELLRVSSKSKNDEVKLEDGTDVSKLKHRHVIVVEGIVDTGTSMSNLLPVLKEKGEPESLELCTLLEKRIDEPSKIKAKYIGFTVPDQFVVGYGLHRNDIYGDIRDVWVLSKKGIHFDPKKLLPDDENFRFL